MSERKFNYERISEYYSEIKKIVGDSSNSDSIAGILNNINEKMHNNVDVCEEAVFGDLGKQLLLDWDNTSSNFPTFLANFNNWAALMAKANNNYQEFENQVAQARKDNPLGVTSGGRTQSYTSDSFYRTYKNENFEDYTYAINNMNSLYEITGVDYVCTDTASLLKWHKIATGVMFGGDILALGTIALASSATVPVGTELVVSNGTGGAVATSSGGAAGATGATGSAGSVATPAIETAANGGATGATVSAKGMSFSKFSEIRNAVSNGSLTHDEAKQVCIQLFGKADGSVGHHALSALKNYFSKGQWLYDTSLLI